MTPDQLADQLDRDMTNALAEAGRLPAAEAAALLRHRFEFMLCTAIDMLREGGAR